MPILLMEREGSETWRGENLSNKGTRKQEGLHFKYSRNGTLWCGSLRGECAVHWEEGSSRLGTSTQPPAVSGIRAQPLQWGSEGSAGQRWC